MDVGAGDGSDHRCETGFRADLSGSGKAFTLRGKKVIEEW